MDKKDFYKESKTKEENGFGISETTSKPTLEPKEEKPKVEVKEEPVVMELVLQEGEAKCDRCQMAFEERLAYKVGMSESFQWGEYQDNDKNITVSTAMKDLKFDTICDVCYNTSIDSNTGSITREWFD
jgi:hypothetical protein